MFSNHLNWIGKLLLLILVVGILFSCSQSPKTFLGIKYLDFPEEKHLSAQVIELDTALFRYPFRIRIKGDKAIVMDLHGSEYYGHLFQYPSFRYLSSFGRRGDSPTEMLSMENFRLYNHELWTLDANKSELTRLDFSS
uniref:BF3164 family lipoprotein n=1 Tax=uncultured Bacteroides sp. TaxID=162156 RepID=UPI0027DC2FA5